MAYFVYGEEFITKNCGKRSAELPAEQIENLPKVKRERGEKTLRPAIHPFRV